MNTIEEAFNRIFVDAVLVNICAMVNRIYKKGATIPGDREEQIAFIYLNSNFSIAHLISWLNKEDVIADARWDLDDNDIGYDDQDLEDGYNYAIAEVKAIFVGA